MKFLIDNNLSYKLKRCFMLAGNECEHVSNLSMQKSDDMQIWSFARNHNYTIVTKDNDFNELLHLNGYPPKILLLRIGNCRTTEIANLLDKNMPVVLELLKEDVGIVELNNN